MENKTDKSIYETIMAAMENGKMPRHFALPDTGPEFDNKKIKMAPGAMDGINIYHFSAEEPTEEDFQDMVTAVVAASSGNVQDAYTMLLELGRKFRAINIIDELQDCVRKHADELDAEQLYRFAVMDLLLEGRDIECVKFGLELLELFDEPDEYVKQIVRNLGLYTEFTIFSVFNMKRWENGNEEIFRLAKNVEGWGRVHAIERLEPETQEIKDWLLFEACDDSVLDSYNALTCVKNSAVAERLKGRITDKEYSAIGQLISNIIIEGPVAGISELPDAESVLADYVSQASLHTLKLADYSVILKVFKYACEDMDFPDLVSMCKTILTSGACRFCIEEALKSGKGVELAIACEIPYQESMLQALKDDFDHQYNNCRYLLNDKDYLEKTLDVFREHIPPESIEQNPQDEIGFGAEFEKYMQLDFLLQDLRDKPFAGIDFVSRTIASPTTRNRTMSMRILKSWVNMNKKPLKELLPDIYDRLLAVRDREVNDGVRASMQQLIDGMTEFDENEM